MLGSKNYLITLYADFRELNDYHYSKINFYFNLRGKVLKCSVCQYVYYCNRNCQREAWSLHKLECSNLKQIAPKILPDSARLMARLILKLQKGGDHEKSYYSENKFRKFKDLMSREYIFAIQNILKQNK